MGRHDAGQGSGRMPYHERGPLPGRTREMSGRSRRSGESNEPGGPGQSWSAEPCKAFFAVTATWAGRRRPGEWQDALITSEGRCRGGTRGTSGRIRRSAESQRARRPGAVVISRALRGLSCGYVVIAESCEAFVAVTETP